MAKFINTKIIKDIPWEDQPKGSFLPMWRYSKNPVIDRNVNKVIDRAYNSAFLKVDDEYVGVFRGEMYNSVPTLFVGRSKDGLHFELEEERIHFVDENDNPLPDTEWSYDPRLVEIDGTYYVIYADNYYDVTIAIAKTNDFKKFVRLPYSFLPNIRNGALFPRQINGKYYMLSRPSDTGQCPGGKIFISDSTDLKYWGSHKMILNNYFSWWNAYKVGPGPTPIETDEGWLVFIHGVISNCNTKVYSMGAMILDRDDPSKIKYLCDNFLLTPSETYENYGFTPNVIFPTCVLCGEDGKMAIYYGAADTYTCIAFTKLDLLIDYIKNHPAKI